MLGSAEQVGRDSDLGIHAEQQWIAGIMAHLVTLPLEPGVADALPAVVQVAEGCVQCGHDF